MWICEDCNEEIEGKVIARTRKNPMRDTFLCLNCDEKDRNEKSLKKSTREKEKASKTIKQEKIITAKRAASKKAARLAAFQTINNVPSPGGSGVSHDTDIVKAMSVLRSSWNKKRSIFFMISSGGNMVRYWDKNEPNMPLWA